MGNLPPLKYEDIDGESLRLLESFSFMGIHIPAGFVCDGQSWCIGEKKAQRAAFLHDWLYWNNGKIAEGNFSRWDADAIFRKALIESGLGRPRAWIRWTGLRAAGWIAWRGHTKRIENEKANSTKSDAVAV